ncbi:MAG: hypothetical protein WAJ85_04425 [Candidatus Baltobacteraceae bacterium]
MLPGVFQNTQGETRLSHSPALAQLSIARRSVPTENEQMEMVP